MFNLGHRDDAFVGSGDATQGNFLGLAAAHEEYPVIITLRQLGHYLGHEFKRVILAIVSRERRNSNPALPGFFLEHDRTHRQGFAVIQASEIIRSVKSQFLEYIAVAVMGRCDWAALVGDERLAACTLLVKPCHGDTVQLHEQADDASSQHVVQVGYGIYLILLTQLPREFHQAKESLVLLFHIDTDYLKVIGTVVEHRCWPGLSHHDKVGVKISAAHGIEHRNGHGDIAERREAHDEHMTVELFIFCHKVPD